MELRPKEIAVIQEVVQKQARFISSHQLPSGIIPWHQGGIVDPWDHVACAMALDLSGRFDEAAKAYMWLRDIQNPDGSYYYSYLNDQPQVIIKDTNYSSYIAAGVWCHYLATGDLGFLSQMWPTIAKSIDFALRLQQPTGEICWALDANNVACAGALIAASSCIWYSIRSGIRIATILGLDKPDWGAASRKLARAIRGNPALFNKFDENKDRYAMSWYYPVLTGVIKGKRAKQHILKRWADFVVDGWGCKCVSDAPWVTVAETCELILALIRIGERDRARLLLDWIFQLQDCESGFWTGIKLPEQIIWPKEKNTWTSAAVIMAVTAQRKPEGKDVT